MSRKHLLLYMRQQQLERLNMKELMNPEETKPNRQILIQSELERVNTELQQQIQQEQLNRLIRRLKEQQQQFENAKKQTAPKHRRKNNMSVTEAPTTRNEVSREIKIAVAKSERKERYKSLRSVSQLKTSQDVQQLEQPKIPLQRRPQTALRSAFDVEPKNLSPGKRGLINLELYKREIQTAMQQERQFRRSSEDNKFQQEILKSVQKCEFRPYSRQSVDTSYNWEKNKKYQAIECFTGNTMYKDTFRDEPHYYNQRTNCSFVPSHGCLYKELFLNHGVAAPPMDKKQQVFEPNPAKFSGKTAYMRNFSPTDPEELRQRLENSWANHQLRNNYRDKMRAGTMVLSKSVLSKTARYESVLDRNQKKL